MMRASGRQFFFRAAAPPVNGYPAASWLDGAGSAFALVAECLLTKPQAGLPASRLVLKPVVPRAFLKHPPQWSIGNAGFNNFRLHAGYRRIRPLLGRRVAVQAVQE